MNFTDKFKPYEIKINGVRLPEIKVDKKYFKQYNIDESVTTVEFLKRLCNFKFKEKGLDKKPNKKEYMERLRMEMAVVEELAYDSYFLMVWDVSNWAEENGIATGQGRGSAVGSLIMYLLNVTKVDPLKHDLFFERFISKARAKKTIIDGITYFDGSLLCDVDTDFDYYRRHEVIKYVHEKYPNRVSKILTTATLQGKIVLKECAKICGNYEEYEVKALSDSIETKFGKVDKISEAFEKSEYLTSWLNEPRGMYRTLSNRRIYEIAQKIEGLPKNYGVHASAIAVTFDNIDDTCPLQITKEGDLVSGFDMKWMAEISVKLDILGLKTLSVIDEVCRKVGLDPSKIDYEDKKIYEYLQDFNCSFGVFQLEADSQGAVAKQLKPADINELSDLLAIARPGAMAYVRDYGKVKAGTKESKCGYAPLDDILHSSKGIVLFQETVMQILNKVFGFSLENAELARRAIAKKSKAEVDKLKPELYEKGKERGVPQNVIDYIWKAMDDGSNYSFNKCLKPQTNISSRRGLKPMSEIKIGEEILAQSPKTGELYFTKVKNIYKSKAELFEFTFDDGTKISCSMEHKLLCEDGAMRAAKDVVKNGYSVVLQNGKRE